MQKIFNSFTRKTSFLLGHAWAFIAALILIIVWLIAGPVFGFSDTWQLVINTATTIITFLMVFVIQNTQNRDSLAINLKLDTIMQELQITKKDLLAAEEKSDEYLEKKKEKIKRAARKK